MWSPEHFYSSTPREFREAVKGHDLFWGGVDRRIAWAVGHVMAPHIKRRGGLLKKLINSLCGKKEITDPNSVKYLLDPELKAQAVVDKIRRQKEERRG